MTWQILTKGVWLTPRGTAVAWCLVMGLVVWGMLAVTAWAQEGQSGITAPASGETIQGTVIVTGTAVDPNFLRYEMAFMMEPNSDQWIVFAEGSQPVINGTLAVWDTTVGRNIGSPIFPDGVYRLRLRVVRTDYNYQEYYATGLIVSNDVLPTATEAAAEETAEPVTPELPVTAVFVQPDILPSLTPFPTPTPLATPANEPLGPVVSETADGSAGLIAQLQNIDTNQFGQAFWQGVGWAVYGFVAVAFYLVIRAAWRWLWQFVWKRMER